MLHLNAGVHLNEVVMPFPVHQKFQRSRVGIAHPLGNFHRVVIQRPAHLLRYGEGGGELHHLLIPPLERAVPLVEMDHVSMLVAQHLNLNVLGLNQELFHEDVVVAECLFGLGLHEVVVDAHFLHGVAPTHTAPAASGGGLENHRKAKLHGELLGCLPVRNRVLGAGRGGHAALNGQRLGG
ncbi:hypothetical protein SDC9_181482 [bioreactor metagenome]|uniref:Uncharacterized protein n=1 Tax=bioreactor metagenome TaxID=1076179 RepID=A0A645H5L2_9ZZZZ